MRDFFKGWKRKAGVVTLVMACVFAAGFAWFQQKIALEHRMQEELLQVDRPWEFFIPVVRSTHSRTITDQNAIRELAESIAVWGIRQRPNDTMLAAGGMGIYIEPVYGPRFRLIVLDSTVSAEFENGECYSCTVTKGVALKKAAEIAGFDYPLSFQFPPEPQ